MLLSFNNVLLRNLSSVLGVVPTEMAKRIGMVDSTVRRILSRYDCRCQFLVDVCNEFHLDISKFFTEDSELAIVHDIVVPDSCWSPVEFHPENLTGYALMPEAITCQALAFHVSAGKNTLHDILVQNIDYSKVGEGGSRYTYASNDEYAYIDTVLQLLPKMAGIQRREFGMAIGASANMLGIATQKKDISVRTLVRICNHYKVDIKMFFQEKSHVFIPANLIDENLGEVRFYASRMHELYGPGTPYRLAQDFKRAIGYTTMRLVRCSSSDSPITAQELVRLCNLMHISPMYFFEDMQAHSDNIVGANYNTRLRILENQLRREEAEKKKLMSQLRHIRSMEDMKK